MCYDMQMETMNIYINNKLLKNSVKDYRVILTLCSTIPTMITKP